MLGGRVFTLGGKFGTVLCNPRHGSWRDPNVKSLALPKGDTPKGDVVDAAPKLLTYRTIIVILQ